MRESGVRMAMLKKAMHGFFNNQLGYLNSLSG
jgi:hypothetical protein